MFPALFLIAHLVAIASSAPSCGSDLLLVMGDVKTTSGRLLFEHLAPSTKSLPIEFTAFESPSVWPVDSSHNHHTLLLSALTVESEDTLPTDPVRGNRETLSSWGYSIASQRTLVVPGSTNVSEQQPRVVEFRGLLPSRSYVVLVTVARKEMGTCEDFVYFHTLQEHTTHPGSSQWLAVSCDRWIDDKDDTFWQTLLTRQQSHSGMIHLGDQIYADFLKNISYQASFHQLLHEFRQVYRRAWNRPVMRSVLRYGAHLFMLDDHDIINNLDQIMMQDKATRHSVSREFLLAGRQAAMEYQYAPMKDWSVHRDPYSASLVATNADTQTPQDLATFQILINRTDSPSPSQSTSSQQMVTGSDANAPRASEPCSSNPYPWYIFKRVASTGFVLLDLRFERTFHPDSSSPLLGSPQFAALSRALDEWNQDESLADIVVFSAVPLTFYAPFSAGVAYQVEKERYPTHSSMVNDTLRLLSMFVRPVSDSKPSKVRLLVHGDSHLFAQQQLCMWQTSGASHCIDVMITSGMTQQSTTAADLKLWLFVFINRYLVALPQRLSDLWSYRMATRNLQVVANYGIITIGERTGWSGVTQDLTNLPLSFQLRAIVMNVADYFLVALTLVWLYGGYRCCFAKRTSKIKQS
eukprot:TRINITY_DN3349_c0_g1_i10.p1 TRINITY_DN3349_c0_g1~~TRINITY_DN3349_c0_g1_i10.p1  ORF type:complete len:636 (+),score=60.27 TRINITY_DN3349_c0_g1_i10:82-1989(+)